MLTDCYAYMLNSVQAKEMFLLTSRYCQRYARPSQVARFLATKKKETGTEKAEKKKKDPGAPYKSIPTILANTYKLEKDLSVIVGKDFASLPEMVSGIHMYIKENNLVIDKGLYKVDSKLKKLLNENLAQSETLSTKEVMALSKGHYDIKVKKVLDIDELCKKYPENQKLKDFRDNK